VKGVRDDNSLVKQTGKSLAEVIKAVSFILLTCRQRYGVRSWSICL